MSNIIDNTIALRILYMLVTPFVKMDAYKLGLIDDKGKLLRSGKPLSPAQRQAFSMLDRIVISLKRLLAKLPGGDNKLKSLIAAYWLVKESYVNEIELNEAEYHAIINKVLNGDIILTEEDMFVRKFLNEEGEVVSSIANVTGEKVSTDIPMKPLFGKRKMFRRKVKQGGLNGQNY
jgi:hypothetical protein